MKLFTKIALVCLFAGILFPHQILANHFAGGYITYKNVGKDSFEVTAHVIADCNGISLNGIQITVWDSVASLFNVNTGSAQTTADVTPICESSVSRCGSSTATIPYGFKKYEFTALVDLTNYNRCIYSFSILGDFNSKPVFIQTTFNKCLAPKNYSAQFTYPGFILGCAKREINVDYGPTDADGDVLKHEFSTLKANFTTNWTYGTGYSYDYPFAVNGGKSGLKLNEKTGQLIFTSDNTMYSIMGRRISEYRNGVKISEINLAEVVIVSNCISNSTTNTNPVLASTNVPASGQVFACPGDTIKLRFSGYDKDSKDTVFIDYMGSLPGASFSVNKQRFPTATVTWVVKKEMLRDEPYYITIKLRDNNCPMFGHSTYVFPVFIKKDTAITAGHKFSENENFCGGINFSAFPISGPGDFFYEWSDTSGWKANVKDTVRVYEKNGRYPVMLKVSSTVACDTLFIFDTVEVNSYAKTFLTGNTTVCEGEIVRLKASTTGKGPFKYIWRDDFYTADSMLFYAEESETIFVTVEDANGCLSTDSVEIEVLPKPKVDAGRDDAFCLNAQAVNLSGSPAGGNWSGNGVTNNRFSPSAAGIGLHTLYYSVTNADGCTAVDSMYITVEEVKAPSLLNDTVFCAGAADFQLPEVTSGFWTGTGISQTKPQYFSPAIAGKGTHSAILTLLSNAGCDDADTTYFTVEEVVAIAEPVPAQCISNAAYALKALPTGGNWTGKGVTQNVFYPELAGPGKHILIYSFTSVAGCASTDSIEVDVFDLPVAAISASTVIAKVNQQIQFTDNSTGNITARLWNFGNPSSGNNTSTIANPTHTYASAGLYKVTLKVWDSTNCESKLAEQAILIEIDSTNSIADIGNGSKFLKLYPNPVGNFLMLETDEVVQVQQVQVYNATGSSVTVSIEKNNNVMRLNTSHLPSGMYVVRITANGYVQNQRFIISR